MGVPFIYQFKTPKSNYFYDVNRNELVRIDEAEYAWLEDLLRRKKSLDEAADVPEQIAELKSNGYLSDYHVEEICHPLTDNLSLALERHIQKITLQLTQACNFRCSYCLYTSNAGGQRTHSSKTMTWETVKKAILFLRDHSVDSPDVYVAFYGGEPFLAFDMMKRAVEFAEEVFRGKTLRYTLTTNAVLLNDESLAFVEKHGMDLMISIDGTKEAHDKNRVFAKDGTGTFDAVIEKILYICKNYPKLASGLMLNMVLDPSYSFDAFDKLFIKYPRLKKLQVNSTIKDDSGALQQNVFSEDFTKRQEYQQFLGYLAAYDRIPLQSISKPLQGSSMQIFGIGQKFNTSEQMPQKAAPSGPCVPGEERLMVTAGGRFVVCEKVNEISDCMTLGDIDNGIDMNKVHGMLNVAKITEEQCKNCWAFFGCNQCGKVADVNGQFSAEERLSHCAGTRRNFVNTLREKAMLEDFQMFYGQGNIL